MRLFTKSPLMMAWFSVFIITMTILPLYAIPIVSISVKAVQLSQPTTTSFNFISNPFIFHASTSLSSKFRFQIGNGVALVIIPHDLPSKFARNMSFEVLDAYQLMGIQFYANVCKISSFGKISNISINSNVLKASDTLSSWIDYHATLKRIDVRVSMLDDPNPVEPLISHGIDLEEISKGENVLLGLVSSNEKQITSAYTWIMEIRDPQNENWLTYTRSYSPGRTVPANQIWLWNVGCFIYVMCCHVLSICKRGSFRAPR